MKKILGSLFMLGVSGALFVAVTTASYIDQEVANGNQFTGGTIDLKLNGQDAGVTPVITVSASDGFVPGMSGTITVALHNAGSVDATALDVMIGNISEQENGIIESEGASGDASDPQGELGSQMLVDIKDGNTVIVDDIPFGNISFSLSSGIPAGQTRHFNIVYKYCDLPTNNLSLSDSVAFDLSFLLKQY